MKLEVPHDGSVPGVLPWQSLRKCSFAAPHFHADDMPLPITDASGAPLVPSPDDNSSTVHRHVPALPAPVVSAADAYSSWTSDRLYPIERIVGAERIGGGWRLQVKWEGFDDDHITPEPLHKILGSCTDPAILEQIEQCKADYLAAHPVERAALEARLPLAVEPRPEPTRLVPDRERVQPRRFMFHVSQLPDSEDRYLVAPALRALRRLVAQRTSVLPMFLPDLPHSTSSLSLMLAAV